MTWTITKHFDKHGNFIYMGENMPNDNVIQYLRMWDAVKREDRSFCWEELEELDRLWLSFSKDDVECVEQLLRSDT